MQEDKKKETELKKEYLKSYGDAVRAEQVIEDEIQQLRVDRMFPSYLQDGMARGDKNEIFSGYIAKVDELLDELKESLYIRIDLRKEIIRKIESMSEETEKIVLRYRYIQLLKWEEIAIRMSYSWKQIHRIHGSALNHFMMT